MRAAIMQPYIFPYLGYFQLIQSVDVFVFYDDVNFIKRGWVNRNKILIQNQEKLISFPCIKASQNKLINDVEVDLENKAYKKLLNSIYYAYKKAPYFEEVMPLITEVFKSDSKNIADLCIASIKMVRDYLSLSTELKRSSEEFTATQNLPAADRLIAISKKIGAEIYINSLGGKALYTKGYFAKNQLNLEFLQPKLPEYEQFSEPFIPSLSIIDVLMFNSKQDVLKMLSVYELS
jgi:hypothetical protein